MQIIESVPRYISPVVYSPVVAPVKTQPITYPANPSAAGTSVVGSPMTAPETAAPTLPAYHAIYSQTFIPHSPVSGISVGAVPSGALSPITGTAEGSSIPLSVQNVTNPSLAAVPQFANAPVVPTTDYSSYALIAAVVLFLYYMLKGE